MQRILVACIFLMAGFPAVSQTPQLSERAGISILTCAPGQQEVFTAFGHSAIHVYDPINGINHAFNYGVFSFGPGFYLNFARGHSNYKLAVYAYDDFLYEYQYYNRSVDEQVLLLTRDQKQKIFDFLVWNARPENQYYRYDYFYDNCATRVRDVFAKELKDDIQFDPDYAPQGLSIRDLTDMYLKQQPWGDLGIDICLGLPMDKVVTPYDYMFLPDYISYAFEHATIRMDSVTKPIVSEKINVFKASPSSVESVAPHPWMVFIPFLGVIGLISFLDYRRRKIAVWVDGILLFVTGLLGIVLLLLWTATDHAAAAKNFNLLWALPTNLIAFILLLFRSKWMTRYYQFAFGLTVLLLIGWPLLPQHLNLFLLPVVIALAIRYGLNVWSRLRKSNPHM